MNGAFAVVAVTLLTLSGFSLILLGLAVLVMTWAPILGGN